MELERDLDKETPRGEKPKCRLVDDSALYPRKRSWFLKAAGALLLIVLLFAFSGNRGDKDALKELEAVKAKLNSLVQDLARIEAVERKTTSSESQIMQLQASVNGLQVLTKSMKEQMERPANAAPATQQVQSVTPQKLASEKRFHVVSRGETIFSISKRYRVSSYELRRLNHLSNNLIQPGQKLIVGT